MWWGILDLLNAGWPKDNLAVLKAGVDMSNRQDVVARLDALCPPTGAPVPADTYCPSLRATLLGWWPLVAMQSSQPEQPEQSCPAPASETAEVPTHSTDPVRLARLLGTIAADIDQLPSDIAATYRRILRGRISPELTRPKGVAKWLPPFVEAIAVTLEELSLDKAHAFHKRLDGTFKYRVGDLCANINEEVCMYCDCRTLATPHNMYNMQNNREELLANGWQNALDELCPPGAVQWAS
eukprot:2389856-Prymnesium_polylepis.1